MGSDLAAEQRAPQVTTAGTGGHRAILATAKGGGFLAGGNFFDFVSRFVIAFLLARLIQADGYGLYNLATSAAAIFAGISCLGLDDAMVRYVAIMSRRRDGPGVWGTIQIGLGLSTLAGVGMGLVLYFAAAPIASGLFDEPRLMPLLQLLALVVPFLAISNVLTGCARGFGRMDYAALGENVIQSLVRMVLLVVLAFVGLDVRTAVIVFGISDVAASLSLLVLINRHFGLRRPVRRDVRRDFREVFSFALPLWFSGLLNQFRRNIETIMLGALSAVASVGVYTVVNRVHLISHVAYRSIIVSVKPVLAQLHDQGDRDGLAQLYATTTRWTLSFNLPFFLVMVLYPEALLGVFGTSFTAGASALVVLAFAELAIAGTGICGSIIDMTGHTRVKLANSVGWLVVLLVSNALLIPRWGVLGAAAASFIATAAVNFARLIEVWVLERVHPYRLSFWKPVVAGLLALGAGLALRAAVPVGGSIVAAAMQATVVMLTYGGALRLFGVAPEDRVVFERVAGRAGRLLGRLRTSVKRGKERDARNGADERR